MIRGGGFTSDLYPGNKNVIGGDHPEVLNCSSGRGSSLLGSTYLEPNHELLFMGG